MIGQGIQIGQLKLAGEARIGSHPAADANIGRLLHLWRSSTEDTCQHAKLLRLKEPKKLDFVYTGGIILKQELCLLQNTER